MNNEDFYRALDKELDRDPYSIYSKSRLTAKEIKVIFDKYVDNGNLDAAQYIAEEIYWFGLTDDTLLLIFFNCLTKGDKYTAARAFNLIEQVVPC